MTTSRSKLRVLDLFSGIGGFSLGLERTGGFETVAFCEIEPYCRRVLAKHWPGVPCYEDINEMWFERGMADMVTAGFPCQDISLAGQGAGLAGKRSSLWWKVRRTIRLVRPRFALLENVAALLHRGMGTVLGSLAAIGYDAEWHCVPLGYVGAPHERDRVWIIANAVETRLPRFEPAWSSLCRSEGTASAKFGNRNVPCGYNWPQLGGYLRMGDGIRREVDEIGALGNSLGPIIPELIGKAILEAEGMTP